MKNKIVLIVIAVLIVSAGLSIAIAVNNSEIQYKIGNYYYNKGTEDNCAEALKWFKKAAEQGNATAQYRLGCFFERGDCLAKDESEAVKWYRLAAEQGNAEAQNCLGSCYKDGRGIVKDEAEAVEL